MIDVVWVCLISSVWWYSDWEGEYKDTWLYICIYIEVGTQSLIQHLVRRTYVSTVSLRTMLCSPLAFSAVVLMFVCSANPAKKDPPVYQLRKLISVSKQIISQKSTCWNLTQIFFWNQVFTLVGFSLIYLHINKNNLISVKIWSLIGEKS